MKIVCVCNLCCEVYTKSQTINNTYISLNSLKLAIYYFIMLTLECLRFSPIFCSANYAVENATAKSLYSRDTPRRYTSERNRTNLIFYIRKMSTYPARSILLVKKKKREKNQ